MGTSYTLHKNETTSLSLDEMSNEFDLCIWVQAFDPTRDDDDPRIESLASVEMSNLTVEEVTEIALEMIKVCSYWAEDRDYMERVAERVRNLY